MQLPAALLALALVVSVLTAPAASLPELATSPQWTGAGNQNREGDGSKALVYSGDGKVQLKLCECERAEGSPAGLSCSKQGWFITSFERQGQWIAGGGYVPLSHAICCRPCLPSELPPDPSGRIPEGQRPLAVVSLGCHPSTDALPVRCEGGGRSFTRGFSEAVRVFAAADTFYPVNNAICCTPTLLLENGDAWELERCDCQDSHDAVHNVNCGGLDTDELLFGYIFYRTTPLGHVVPVGPAQCCKVCLSPALHPMDSCDDLHQCSKNGVCNLGQCDCFDGWAGADCSKWVGGGGGGGRGSGKVPPWAVALIVLSSTALAGLLLVAAGHVARLAQEWEAGGGGGGSEAGEERAPLLLRIDADDAGSVGSQDTECGDEDEEELEEVEERVHEVLSRLEHRVPGISREGAAGAAHGHGPAPAAAAEDGQHQRGTPTPASPRAAGSSADPQGRPAGQHAAPAGQQPEREGAGAGFGDGTAAGVAAAPAMPVPAAGRSHASEGEEGAAASDAGTVAAAAASAAAAAAAEANGGGGSSRELLEEKEEEDGGELSLAARMHAHPPDPLGSVDCIICCSRPVQAVLVPCGHVCCCRRCSRKLERCPLCRKTIARRQKLFI